jgi:hypothetical protein
MEVRMSNITAAKGKGDDDVFKKRWWS